MTDPKIIELHTSDRGTYKRCRRKFGWGSTLRDNLVREGPDNKAFFIGTGFHFACEDYFGYRRFSHPALAFAAYYDAQKQDDLPDDAEASLDLVTGMLTYYVEDWLVEHPEEFETFVIDGRPQVEVEVAVDITELLLEEEERRGKNTGTLSWNIRGVLDVEVRSPLSAFLDGRRVHYIMTFDRVVIDQHERIWGVDYKTAAQFDELNLQTNPQAGAYDWGMDLFYTPAGYKPGGIIWQQHKKVVPVPPKLIYEGKPREGFSQDASQSTTYRLYKHALVERFGTIPEQYNGFLAMLGESQDFWGDRFIRRDYLRRNQVQREVEQSKIVAEALEMLDPGLVLYPNPTKDCSWDCPFKVPCLAMDDGSDYKFILEHEYAPVEGYKDDWRTRVKYPDAGIAHPTFSHTPAQETPNGTSKDSG